MCPEYYVILIIKIACCLGQQYAFRSDSALANMMCSADKVQFSTTSVNDIACVRACSLTQNCHAVIFYHGTSTCYGLNTDNSFNVTIPLPGAVFYKSTVGPGCEGSFPMVAPLSDSQFSASSEFSDYTAPRARLNELNDTKSWSPITSDPSEYLQVDFSEPRMVTSIITRGDPIMPRWVTSYNVLISNDCTTFTAITNVTGTEQM